MHGHIFDRCGIPPDIRLQVKAHQCSVQKHQNRIQCVTGYCSHPDRHIAEIRAENKAYRLFPFFVQDRCKLFSAVQIRLIFFSVPDSVQEEILIFFPVIFGIPADTRINTQIKFRYFPAFHKIPDLFSCFIFVSDSGHRAGKHTDPGQDPFHIPSFCSHYPEFFVNLVNFLIAPAGLSVYRNGGQKNSAAFRPAAFHPFFQDFHSFPAGSFNRTVYSRHPPKDRFPQRIKSGNGNIAGN